VNWANSRRSISGLPGPLRRCRRSKRAGAVRRGIRTSVHWRTGLPINWKQAPPHLGAPLYGRGRVRSCRRARKAHRSRSARS